MGGGFCVCSLCCYALLSALSSFIIILLREREGKLVVLLYMSSLCLVTVSVLWLFLKVPWVGLQCVIVVFPDHTHLLLSVAAENKANSFIFLLQYHYTLHFLQFELNSICIITKGQLSKNN